MRGLKLYKESVKYLNEQSHLLQMRGLKQINNLRFELFERVASFTDAWIETTDSKSKELHFESHLLQMRGLKLRLQARAGRQLQVASFTDAWIETTLQRRV